MADADELLNDPDWPYRCALTRCIADGARKINVPIHVTSTFNRAVEALGKNLPRDPSVEEVAEKMKELTRSRKSLLEEAKTLYASRFNRPDLRPERPAIRTILDEFSKGEVEILKMAFDMHEKHNRKVSLEEISKLRSIAKEEIQKTIERFRERARVEYKDTIFSSEE